MSRIKSRQHGIALIEALVAIVILGIGLLGAIGMQARAVSALSDAGMRAEATLATSKLVGMMSTDMGKLNEYQMAATDEPGERLEAWHAETTKAIPDAKVKISVTPIGPPGAVNRSNRVDVSIGWRRRDGDPLNSHEVSFYLSESK